MTDKDLKEVKEKISKIQEVLYKNINDLKEELHRTNKRISDLVVSLKKNKCSGVD